MALNCTGFIECTGHVGATLMTNGMIGILEMTVCLVATLQYISQYVEYWLFTCPHAPFADPDVRQSTCEIKSFERFCPLDAGTCVFKFVWVIWVILFVYLLILFSEWLFSKKKKEE